jgi:hypothetical protein
MNAFLKALRRIATPVHSRLRKRKVRTFFEALEPCHTDTLLDVGGWVGSDTEFFELYSFFPDMTSINLIQCEHGHARFVCGDACAMPFESKSHDYVFSNAVIEHVGRYDRQQMMANEIRRVARKGYFVSTPNRWFPIDPHSYLPFFHLMPLRIRRWMNPRDDYFMLSPAKMRSLFPEASVVLTPDGTSVLAVAKLSESGQVTATRAAAAGAR